MAIDVYLQIDSIKGESQDDKHKDWIEVTGVHWGVFQPRSATASTSGGHTAERAELDDISFSKIADLSSPILAQTCAMGKTLPKAKFEFFRADGFDQFFQSRPIHAAFAKNPARDDDGMGIPTMTVQWPIPRLRISAP